MSAKTATTKTQTPDTQVINLLESLIEDHQNKELENVRVLLGFRPEEDIAFELDRLLRDYLEIPLWQTFREWALGIAGRVECDNCEVAADEARGEAWEDAREEYDPQIEDLEKDISVLEAEKEDLMDEVDAKNDTIKELEEELKRVTLNHERLKKSRKKGK